MSVERGFESLHIPDFPQCLPPPRKFSTRIASPPPACWSFPAASISSNSSSSKNSSRSARSPGSSRKTRTTIPRCAAISKNPAPARCFPPTTPHRPRPAPSSSPISNNGGVLIYVPGRAAVRNATSCHIPVVPPPGAVRLRLADSAGRHRLPAGIQPVGRASVLPAHLGYSRSPNRSPPRMPAWRPTTKRCWKPPRRPSVRGPCSRARSPWPCSKA